MRCSLKREVGSGKRSDDYEPGASGPRISGEESEMTACAAALLEQELKVVVGADGSAEKMALGISAIVFAEEVELLFRFDTLSHDIHLQ